MPGKSLTVRLNVENSGLNDVVIPFVFSEDVAVVLNQQTMTFNWASRTVKVDGPMMPLASLDPKGSPIVLSYDVPEPTSYRGRNVIELDIDLSCFSDGAQPLTGADDAPGEVYDTQAVLGSAVPAARATAARDLPPNEVAAAFETARLTGFLDPVVFPSTAMGQDSYSQQCIVRILARLTPDVVLLQYKNNNRLTFYTDTSGNCQFQFVPDPDHGVPMLLLVEYYRLSSFPARYGAGRTIKTFSLLPGERTSIRINTYKRSTESAERASSILDSSTDETQADFERTVLSEQTSQDDTSKTFEYNAQAEAEATASWGWGNARGKVSGGVKGSTNSAREEFAKNVSNAVAHTTARASARRDVEVNTSQDMKLEIGEEQAIERELQNINVSRTLNFVFRQMNQEFVSILHLTDVRVAFFNGYAQSRREVPLSDLESLLDTYILAASHDQVRDTIQAELALIKHYRGEVSSGFIQTVALDGGPGAQNTYQRVNPDLTSPYLIDPDSPVLNVQGVIVSADRRVMRTDAVVVDTFIGLGNGLDDYSIGLQAEAIRSRQIANEIQAAECDKLQLATQIIRDGDDARAALFQRLFPANPIVNQIEQAVIGSSGTPDPTDSARA